MLFNKVSRVPELLAFSGGLFQRSQPIAELACPSTVFSMTAAGCFQSSLLGEGHQQRSNLSNDKCC